MFSTRMTKVVASFAAVSGAVAKLTLNRRHQIVTARYLPRSRSAGMS
jgi:hypothetical protein